MSRIKEAIDFPPPFLALFKDIEADTSILKPIIQTFCKLSDTSVGIFDSDLLCIDWMSNRILNFEWKMGTKKDPMTLSEFVHKDDLPRLMQDLAHMKRFNLSKYESLYRMYDLNGEFNWDLISCTPVKYDRNNRFTHLIVFSRHINHAIANSQFIEQILKERREASLKMLELRISPREKDVLFLILDAKTDDEIAEALFIGKKTVITHRRNLLRKLKAKNKLDLVRIVGSYGL